MQEKRFLKIIKILTVFIAVGIIFIGVCFNLIAIVSDEPVPFVVRCLINIALILGFVFNIRLYRFYSQASYSFSVQDDKVIFSNGDKSKTFVISNCQKITFSSQWVKFYFPLETICLINFISAKDVIFAQPQIDPKTAKQIFTNAIIKSVTIP